ncbi:MAG: AAA family ATPase [Methylococcaceae bacterium]
MYIKSLIYEDQSINWKLELMEFKPLTLLVGVSGVGKTKILNALLNLKDFSKGTFIAGFKWEIVFTVNEGVNYKWRGEIEGQITSGNLFEFESYPKTNWNNPPIYYEQLFINDELIIDRNNDGIYFDNKQIVQLPRNSSILFLFKEISTIQVVYESFDRIITNDVFRIKNEVVSFKDLKNKLIKSDIHFIRSNIKTIAEKLYLCRKNVPDIFEEIKYLFIDIFPHVEDLIVDTLSSLSPNTNYISIAIKEKYVDYLIHEEQMSLGMLKTLTHIAELYLCADGSVILIDEFENSLGINCINEITSSILASERNLQFIITSHHPYIINAIDTQYWKVVTRKGSVVKVIDAKELGIGKSKHEKFMQLINLHEYTDGITYE